MYDNNFLNRFHFAFSISNKIIAFIVLGLQIDSYSLK